jgi:hypothetical protein
LRDEWRRKEERGENDTEKHIVEEKGMELSIAR